jgi:hypothetical protein
VVRRSRAAHLLHGLCEDALGQGVGVAQGLDVLALGALRAEGGEQSGSATSAAVQRSGAWLLVAVHGGRAYAGAANLDDGHDGGGGDEDHDDQGGLRAPAQLAQDGASAKNLGAGAGQEACGGTGLGVQACPKMAASMRGPGERRARGGQQLTDHRGAAVDGLRQGLEAGALRKGSGGSGPRRRRGSWWSPGGADR